MSFFWAMGGAAFIYILNARNSRRLEAVFTYPKQNWRMLLFDFVLFLLMAGVFVYILIEPNTRREAFMAGATWEGAASAMFGTTAVQESST
ncbi:hypothetical protein GWN75_11040 [candidate division KSB1 bacterium]|nr:hypothetical protein [candidate division KSB1 bacterium]NIR70123.1 hypothetical protein [candidate division KSB1 bacterium]NIS24439.1 hypothetical protein [candidate division KSB1 bacterium]NIU25056.1 hypothetical protein [candidate division KSB1 bacterium]NIW18911.1 hypothetical protein [candidate division KSB1 bacterium]